jgi:hypothetical protein
MDRLTTLLLRLTPDERAELARQVAKRVAASDDDAVEDAWLEALERRFGEPEAQTSLFDDEERQPHG